jgi:hypothetical protein
MRQVGPPNNFSDLFSPSKFNPVQLSYISGDYTLIVWWADAMSRMAGALYNLLAFMSQYPQWDPENNAFKTLRSNLDSTMGDVTRNTQNRFSEPWGLVAMDLASGQKGDKVLQLVCPRITLALPEAIAQAKLAVAA